MAGRPPRGFSPREREHVETQTQSRRRDVRTEMQQSRAMMEENARIDRRTAAEREVGSSIEPGYITADSLRPIKFFCEKGYHQGITYEGFRKVKAEKEEPVEIRMHNEKAVEVDINNDKVLAACEKIILYNGELSQETRRIYQDRHGDVSKEECIDATAFLLHQTGKINDRNVYYARNEIIQALKGTATYTEEPPFASPEPVSPEDRSRPPRDKRKEVLERISKARGYWGGNLERHQDKLNELNAAGNDIDAQLAVVNKYRTIREFRSRKKIDDPELQKQRSEDLKRISRNKSKWNKDRKRHQDKLNELNAAGNDTDAQLAVVDKYTTRRH